MADSASDKPKLTTRQLVVAILRVGMTTYRASPVAIIVQVTGTIMSAVLPIITTYFAAATTTALAAAYAGNPDAWQQVITYLMIAAGLGVVQTAWSSLETYLSQAMQYRVEAAMTDRMYEHFLRLEFWRYDDKATADLYDKARKFGQFFPYIFNRITSMVTALVSMIAGIVALAFVSWWLALIAFVAIIPGLVIQMRLSRQQAKHWNDNVEARRIVNSIEWGLMRPQNIVELRLYGLVRHLLDLRLRMRDKDEKQRIEFERRYIWKRFGADVLEAITEVVALIWTALQIIARNQPIGQFFYVQQVVGRALSGASSLVRAISAVDEDIANLFDYQAFMELPEGVANGARITGVPDAIAVDHVSFHYPRVTERVLDDVSFTIHRGQHVAIVGENGAGKSTLIKLLAGLYQPVAGAITLDGQVLASAELSSWHKQLGVLSQDFMKYNFADARHNIVFGDISGHYSKERLAMAIDTAEAGFLHKLPRGLDSYVDQWMEDDKGNKGHDLSGGQWQRLALARNFYRDAPIIILDEPTSAIDALAESRIFKHLFTMHDKTIITISHRLTTVEKADVVYMLQEGKLIESGTAAELIAKRGAFYRMFESQIK